MMPGKDKAKQLCESCGKSYVNLTYHRKSKSHLRKIAQSPMPFATVEAVKCPTR